MACFITEALIILPSLALSIADDMEFFELEVMFSHTGSIFLTLNANRDDRLSIAWSELQKKKGYTNFNIEVCFFM
jgi:hypothetical protein